MQCMDWTGASMDFGWGPAWHASLIIQFIKSSLVQPIGKREQKKFRVDYWEEVKHLSDKKPGMAVLDKYEIKPLKNGV